MGTQNTLLPSPFLEIENGEPTAAASSLSPDSRRSRRPLRRRRVAGAPPHRFTSQSSTIRHPFTFPQIFEERRSSGALVSNSASPAVHAKRRHRRRRRRHATQLRRAEALPASPPAAGSPIDGERHRLSSSAKRGTRT